MEIIEGDIFFTITCYHFELLEIKIMVIIIVDFLKDIFNVFNANIISDGFEEDDNFSQTEVSTPVEINLVEEIVKIFLQRGGAVCAQQLLLGLPDERMFGEWPRCLPRPTRTQALE